MHEAFTYQKLDGGTAGYQGLCGRFIQFRHDTFYAGKYLALTPSQRVKDWKDPWGWYSNMNSAARDNGKYEGCTEWVQRHRFNSVNIEVHGFDNFNCIDCVASLSENYFENLVDLNQDERTFDRASGYEVNDEIKPKAKMKAKERRLWGSHRKH